MFMTKGNMKAVYRQFQMYLDNELFKFTKQKDFNRLTENVRVQATFYEGVDREIAELKKEILELKIKIAGRDDLIKIIKGE